MEIWILTAVIAILCALIVVREWQNYKDRRDLMDRLMSADFKEYKRFNSKPAARAVFPPGMNDAEMAIAQYNLDQQKKAVNA